MKYFTILLPIFLLTILLSSCNNEATNTSSKSISEKPVSNNIPNENPTGTESLDLELDLISLEIVDSNNTDVFTRYGIITSGMCYDCNLANISVSKGKIQFTNICDSTNRVSYDITKIEQNGGTVEIGTKENIFALEAISGSPVYRLKLKDISELNKNLKLVEYYAGKKGISKFKLHDCGDFEG